jgi:pyridoxal phosphate phosphatase PHOSPHO2
MPYFLEFSRVDKLVPHLQIPHNIKIQMDSPVTWCAGVVALGIVSASWVLARRQQKGQPLESKICNKTLVVWDFDWSLVNENSDTWIVKVLDSARHAGMRARYHAEFVGNWTRLMDTTLRELSTDHDREALLQALLTIPVDPYTLMAVRLAAETTNAEQRILSDANSWFIDAITEHLEVADHFTTVVTNPSRWEESTQILRVAPFHVHACVRCPSNLCKGRVLDAWRAELRPDRIIYVGDGGGDLCPSLRLGPRDSVCARAGYPLHEKLVGVDASRLVGRLRPWVNGEELLAHFQDALSSS